MWIDELDLLEAVDDDEAAAAAGLRAEVEAGVVDEVLVFNKEEDGFEARDGVDDCGVACRLGAISLGFFSLEKGGGRDERECIFFFSPRRGILDTKKKKPMKLRERL